MEDHSCRAARHDQPAIAELRGISQDGVKFHIENVRGKLGLPRPQGFASVVPAAQRQRAVSAAELMLTQGEAPPAAESLLYFRVPHIGRAHAELQRRRVEFGNAPHMIHPHADGTEEWMAFFEDPDGRPVAIMSQVRNAP